MSANFNPQNFSKNPPPANPLSLPLNWFLVTSSKTLSFLKGPPKIDDHCLKQSTFNIRPTLGI